MMDVCRIKLNNHFFDVDLWKTSDNKHFVQMTCQHMLKTEPSGKFYCGTYGAFDHIDVLICTIHVEIGMGRANKGSYMRQ